MANSVDSAYLLKMQDLTKSFGGIRAVDGVSISIKRGETVSIIGPNGAGKTTVFNLITQFYRPDKGTINFDGHDICKVRPFKIPRLGIGRTFQNLRLFKSLTVKENILSSILQQKGYNPFSATFRTKQYANIEKNAHIKARELANFLQLNDKEELIAGSLAYGDQRRLELARALAIEPKLILIDEPAAGMNQREIQDLIVTIRQVKESFGLTIVIIEHQMSLVMSISERIIVMDFGEKIMEGTPEEVKKDKRVIEAYLGEEIR